MAAHEPLIPPSRPYLVPLLFFGYLALLPYFEASTSKVLLGGTGVVVANMALITLCLLVEIALHELGHAWAGRRAGATIALIEVGTGPTVWQGHLFGHRWVLRAVPMTGRTILTGPTATFAPKPWALISAAGPAVDLMILLLAIAALSAFELPSSLAAVVNPVQAAYVVSKLSLFWNLLPTPPMSNAPGSSATGSDGWAIARAMLGKHAAFQRLARPTFDDAAAQHQANALLEAGKIDEGLALVDDRLTLAPGHIGLRYYRGALLTVAGRTDEAVDVLRAVALDPDFARFKDGGGATVKAWLAKALLAGDTPQALAEAEAVAQSAAQLQWESAFARCVLGEALFKAGKTHASIQHLEYAARNGTASQKEAASALLAVASPRANPSAQAPLIRAGTAPAADVALPAPLAEFSIEWTTVPTKTEPDDAP